MPASGQPSLFTLTHAGAEGRLDTTRSRCLQRSVYRGQHQTLLLLPGIISLFIMCIGIIKNNFLVGGCPRLSRAPATECVTLYCTWWPSALITRPRGQVSAKVLFWNKWRKKIEEESFWPRFIWRSAVDMGRSSEQVLWRMSMGPIRYFVMLTWWWFSRVVQVAGRQPAVSDEQWCRLPLSPGPPPSCGACRQCGGPATTAWHVQPYHTAPSTGRGPYIPADLPYVCPSPDPWQSSHQINWKKVVMY